VGECVYLGDDNKIWERYGPEEMVTLKTIPLENAFASWALRNGLSWLDEYFGRLTQWAALALYFDFNAVIRLQAFLSMVLSAAFPVLAMHLLSTAGKSRQELWVSTGSTSAFAACLGLFAKVNRLGTFLAVTVFAIFEVVYMSNGAPTK
jgi:hypothetical protein